MTQAAKSAWPKDDFSRVAYWVYDDPDVYRQEQEGIYFSPVWNYLGMEAEIAQPGDYKTTLVGDMPVIVSRAPDGAIHAFENRCAHRGALLALKNKGRAKDFVCVYHNLAAGISAPRIGVSGVNPHPGESGLFGSEEAETIEPAVQQARARGLDVVGPIGADTLLPRTDFDAFVVMLHDQGHILAKSAAPHGAAALSVGTPIIFSSVGQGTAMDIAGKGEASPEAIVQAVLQVANAARSQELTP